MKVDFFIVGAAKSGTTSLYNYLFKHPEVCMSSIKEPNFFSNKLLNEQKMYYKDVKIDSIRVDPDLGNPMMKIGSFNFFLLSL